MGPFRSGIEKSEINDSDEGKGELPPCFTAAWWKPVARSGPVGCEHSMAGLKRSFPNAWHQMVDINFPCRRRPSYVPSSSHL
jgi:hypothetical protein